MFTNLVYSSRRISPDGATLHSTRYWILGKRIRILAEEGVNEVGASSLEAVPEPIWATMSRTFELIRNEQGTYVRMRRPDRWPELAARLKEDYASKEGVVQYQVFDPSEWQEFATPDLLLAKYPLTIDANHEVKAVLAEAGLVKEKGSLALRGNDQQGAMKWKLLFDPVTGLQLRERRWYMDRLVFEARWDTNTLVDARQFTIPDKELEAWRQRFGEKAGGIGIILSPGETTGPFTIAGVLSNSPAANAGLQPGSIVVAIDGHDTQDMPKQLAIELIRGLPETRVTIDTVDSRTGKRLKFELKRDLLRPRGDSHAK